MTTPAGPTEIFDRRIRRLRRDRAARDFTNHDFLHAHMRDELFERLAAVTRSFGKALVLGGADSMLPMRLRAQGIDCVVADAGFRFARQASGVQCDEDRLPFADASFDLVLSGGVLDSVNDLPGALALIRRILKPDGLFLGAYLGAGSLPCLRAAMAAADGDRAAPRIHPQIDVRSGGDLLMRAGLALPVADGERLVVRYSSVLGLVADLRGMAAGNILKDRGPSLRREQVATAIDVFQQMADADGKTGEIIEMVYLSGWAPSPEQPQPARRGSGTVSLADALKRKH